MISSPDLPEQQKAYIGEESWEIAKKIRTIGL